MKNSFSLRLKAWVAAAVFVAIACGPKAVEHAELPVECPPAGDRDAITWYQVDDSEERAQLLRWCAAVGAPVLDGPDRPASSGPIDSIAVVTWNTHVGAGSIGYFIRQLETGVLTRGVPVEHFVILLQETFRAGPPVPIRPPAGSVCADEIFPSRELGERRDVVTIADENGLFVYYVPSMRNGEERDPPEDRGNAILSTLPLTELTAWELPFREQRRVSIGAAVEGETSGGEKWRLAIIDLHLAPRAGMRTFFRSFTRVRERQMQFLLERIPDDGAAVIGGDFNTWLGERAEPAVQLARKKFTEPQELPSHGTLQFGAVLERQTDFMFFRLPGEWTGDYRRIDDTYGSDHYPLLGWIRFGTAHPASELDAPGQRES